MPQMHIYIYMSRPTHLHQIVNWTTAAVEPGLTLECQALKDSSQVALACLQGLASSLDPGSLCACYFFALPTGTEIAMECTALQCIAVHSYTVSL